MEADPIVVFHERVELPLLHTRYDVIVGEGWKDIFLHTQTLWPGVSLDISSSSQGYCCIVKHPIMGESFLLLLNTQTVSETPLMSVIAHECTNLSWYILESMDVEIHEDNHEIQALVMAELVWKVHQIYKGTLENKNDLEDL